MKDRRRNRLAQGYRADKLVRLFHNLRLQKKMNIAHAEPAVGWTEDDMHLGITKFGVFSWA